MSAAERLRGLQQRISQRNDPNYGDEDTEKLYFAESQGLFSVEFYGTPFDEAYADFLQTICDPEVASQLKSLSLRGPDEGSNGTRDWDLTPLLETPFEFPALISFFLEPTAPEHHNHTIIGSGYEEEGQIGRLLAKSPSLRSLTVPSAPDANFFQTEPHPLTFLRVDTGYDHQNFIANLSQSSCFPGLRLLDFGDYNLRFMEGYPEQCTPFEDYERLFQSAAFASVRVFRFRNSILSSVQLTRLKLLRKDLSILMIQAYGDYFRG